MPASTLHLDIVSAEQAIFSGDVEHVSVSGEMGELGIFPGHTALLSHLKPGEVRYQQAGEESVFYVSGGMLEVQPFSVSILADTITRAGDIDERAAIAAKQRAEKALKDRKTEVDYAAASVDLAEALAQLRAISRMKNRR